METTIVVIVAIIFFATVITYKFRQHNTQTRQNNEDAVIATVNIGGTLRLTATELIEGYTDDAPRHPIEGLMARVEDSGTLNRRVTATRLVALGIFALATPKKQDDRELFLTIEGPGTVILRTIQLKNAPQMGTVARKFAMQVNQLAHTTQKITS